MKVRAFKRAKVLSATKGVALKSQTVGRRALPRVNQQKRLNANLPE